MISTRSNLGARRQNTSSNSRFLLHALFILSTALLFTVSTFADEIYEPFQTVRQLGMGGVYTFSDHDASVLFHNPAGLNRISGINWTLFNLNVGINGVQIYDSLKDIGPLDGLSSASKIVGKNIWVGADGYSAIATPNFGFGVFNNGTASLRLDNPVYPDLSVDFYNHYGFEVGGSVPLGPGFSGGIALKRLTQQGGHEDFLPIFLSSVKSANTLTAALNAQGVGYGIDTGLLYTPPLVPLSPTVSLAWLDVGDTAFQSAGTTVIPPHLKNNLTLSTTASTHVPYLGGFALGLEYRHINDSTEPATKKLHVGGELSVFNMDFRAGFSQGYTTYGFGIDLLLLQIDLAEYTVERGAYAGQLPDQRIELSIQMDFDFDLDWNLLGAGGSNRRLKQRR